MDKPEALRLADELRAAPERSRTSFEAAAELRRLHAENERLHQINQSHEVKLSVRGYEIQIADLEAQRDALLEALRVFVSCALPVSTEIDERGHSWTEAYLDQALPIARAAIAKAVEGEKT